jgi:hypothetical protein
MIFEQREITMDRARRIAAILAVLLASATPASARNVIDWQCEKVKVILSVNKTTDPYSYDISFGEWEPDKVRINFVWPAKDGEAYLNGKRCQEIPYDPERK